MDKMGNLQPFPWGGMCVNPRRIAFSTLDYFEQNGNLKFFIRLVWGKGHEGGGGEGLVTIRSLLTLIKKGTRTFNLRSNEHPTKFIRSPLPHEVAVKKKLYIL